jgi:mRNA interferase MazF
MNRGDVYLANLDPSKGTEQAGTRPVLVFEADSLIQVTLPVVVIPLTGNIAMEKLPTCVLIPAGEGGLKQDSIAICHQIRALDKNGLVDYWGTLSERRISEVENIVMLTLGINR